MARMEGHWRKYRVNSIELATDEDLFGDYEGIDARRVGDLLVDIEWQTCWNQPWLPTCRDISAPTIFTLRKTSDRWSVVHVKEYYRR